jgi:four helix bundle protein
MSLQEGGKGEGEMPKPWDLRERTKLFTVSVLRFCRMLPATAEAAEIANQLRRAGGSVGAHTRAASRNRSESDYINKISGALEEADECAFWLEILMDAEIESSTDARPLLDEANELCAIFVSSKSTAQSRRLEKRRASKGRLARPEQANAGNGVGRPTSHIAASPRDHSFTIPD